MKISFYSSYCNANRETQWLFSRPSFQEGLKPLGNRSLVLRRISFGAGRPLATLSIAVGRLAAKQGSLHSPRGRLVDL